MTSTDLVVRDHAPERVQLSTEQIQFLANTEFVDKRIRGNLPAIFATIATGRELGIGDMAALRHVFMIDGKPGYSAEIMVALVHRAERGHQITGSTSAEKAIAKGRRGDTGAEIEVTWTIEDAKRAGLVNKSNWKSFPQSMLWARAVSQLCRMLFADVAAGNSFYTPEELGEEHTDEGGGLPLDPPPYDAAEDVPFGDDPAPYLPPTSSAGEPQTVEVPLRPPPVSQAAAGEPVPAPPADTTPKPATAAQAKKLNVLVGQLREGAGKIRTDQLWKAVALVRGVSDDELILELGGLDENQVLHWSPLRESLSRVEAHALIDRLERLGAEPVSPFQPPAGVQAQLEETSA